MRVVYLAAGAGGMLCGSCLRDNRLVATLRQMGHDVTLIPLYTPLRTDEADVSAPRVLFGGLNVYLQQHSALFRHAPAALDALIDSSALLKLTARFASRTRPEQVANLAASVLRGDHGRQRREVRKLIRALEALRPNVVNLPNLMFLGVARPLGEALRTRIVCTLGGEDLFIEQLPGAAGREVMRLIAEQARCVHAYAAVSGYYARRSIQRFSLPAERVETIPLGVNMPAQLPEARGRSPAAPFLIGYLARVAPEKGLRELARAFVCLRDKGLNCRLLAAGYLSPAARPYLDSVRDYLLEAGHENAFEYRGEVSLEEKQRFLEQVHVLSVPAVYPEAKGTYAMEALAAGTPIVMPGDGVFPEMIAQTQGGLLHEPGSVEDLAKTLERLMSDEALRRSLALAGARQVRIHYSAAAMASAAWAMYERVAAAPMAEALHA